MDSSKGVYDMNGADEGNREPRRHICKIVWIVLLFLSMLACIVALAIVLGLRDQQTPTRGPPTTDNPLTTDGPPTTVSSPTTVGPPTTAAPTSATGEYSFAAVAADNAQCSSIGTRIMAVLGGNAVDAAVATLLCLGVHNSHSMGIGGGFLMTIYDRKTGKIETLNSREVAPLAATKDMFVNSTTASTYGGLAIAVPGEIAGYAAVHDRYGKLPWADLFQPTIDLCLNGYTVSQALADAIVDEEKDIRSQPGSNELFVKADGTLYRKGDVMKRPVFAQTLNRIARDGPESFYNGTLADDIIADITDNGGIITNEDLRRYQPVWKEPVSLQLQTGEYTLYGPPPPSSAAVMYYILNILDGYGLTPAARANVTSQTLLAHRIVEAMKFGYGKRSFLGDEDFVNVTEFLADLKSDSFAEATRRKINDSHVLDFDGYDSAFEILNDAGTSHLSVYGPDGLSVSVTSTINTYFGSNVRGNRTGIIFNNEMDDFSTPGTVNMYGVVASPSNYIMPGKRPMSSMSPTIVLDKHGQVALIVGASGGTRIITGILEVIVNSLWLGYNITEALDQPRYHHQLLPDQIQHELSFPTDQDIRKGLEAKGHEFFLRSGIFCVVQAIENVCVTDLKQTRPCIQAASDKRKGGKPDGY